MSKFILLYTDHYVCKYPESSIPIKRIHLYTGICDVYDYEETLLYRITSVRTVFNLATKR